MNTFTADDQKKSWLFLARKFKFFDTLVVIWPIIENICKKEMNDFGSITTSVICEWWRKNLCHILATSWQILHKKFVVYEMMRQAGGKETLSEDDTPNRTSFEWFAVAVNDDELVMWRFFPKLLNLKETLQKILQPFLPFRLKPNYVNYSTFSGFWNSDFSCFCSIWPRVSLLMV